jgi:uncharacterized membrane protein YfcA
MNTIIALIIGLISGYLSGQFGIGGGLITTPAIRIILQRSAFIALGTPLAIIIPAAVTGVVNYGKSRLIDWQLGFKIAFFGIVGTLAGTYMTNFIRGDILMLLTAAIVLAVAFRFLNTGNSKFERHPKNKFSYNLTAILLGLTAGFYAGFLGLGGGFIIIPGLTAFFETPIKKAFGTSLLTIALMAIPGTVYHYFLGHVDLTLALLIISGSIPGAYLGSRVTIGMNEKTLRISFGIFLVIIAIFFGGFEILRLV